MARVIISYFKPTFHYMNIDIVIVILIVVGIYAMYHYTKYNERKKDGARAYILSQKSLKIPRIIHQTFRTSELHPELSDNVRKLRERNPNYEYRFYGDKDIEVFIRDNYPEDILTTYRMINPEYGPAKADYFRYLLMHKVGGVYLDIKSNCSKPFDEIIQEDDEIILTHWQQRWNYHILHNTYGEYCQWIMINSPGHPLLKKVIDSVTKKIRDYTVEKDGVGKWAVITTTGPLPYYYAINPDILEHNVTVYNDHTQLGLSYNNCKTHHEKIFNNHYTTLTTPVAGVTYTYPVYVTLTTIPERLRNPWFYENLQRLMNLSGEYQVILNLPYYMKNNNEEYVIPTRIHELQARNLRINRIDEDFGPLTKLYGALLDKSIHPRSPLLVCDDDIHYKDDFVSTMLRDYYKDPSKIYTYCDDTIQGYKGFMIQKQRILPILNLRRPKSCFRIDDNFITNSIHKLGIQKSSVAYDGDTSWTCSMDQRKTDTHPPWSELYRDDRGSLSHKCKREFDQMN